MGAAVAITEEAMYSEGRDVERKKEEGSSSEVRWERFLPRMVIKVLLVEADDSTRHIINALLRKCSYRVTAVSDGLKAWEILREKTHDIDVILMEVELPSISGFALLTLIMEHEICKSIPVIMMSTNDSISTVYKCMLRGAADFLVKPLRKNELTNLWQHVWRRQASANYRHGPQDEQVTAENNASSNHSSSYMTCSERNKESVKKGNDAQSSCTKPDLDLKAEIACSENVQDFLQLNWSQLPASDMEISKHEECVKSGLVADCCKDVNPVTQEEDMASEREREHVEACDNNRKLVNSSLEAIDLIGAFGNYTKCSHVNDTEMVDSSPQLDLSLKSHANDSVNHLSDKRNSLNNSDASAFSRYINRAFQPLDLSVSASDQQKNYGTNLKRHVSNQSINHKDSEDLPLSSEKNMLSLDPVKSGRAEVACPIPVSVRDIRFESLRTAYGSVIRQIFYAHPSPSPMQSPSSGCPQEALFQVNAFHLPDLETRNSPQFDNLISHNAITSANQSEQGQGYNLESSGDRLHFSSDQNATNSFRDGTTSRMNSSGCGSNGNSIGQIQVLRATADTLNEEVFSHEGKRRHQSAHREAAVTKFLQKRKDRCFEKKVRYESRKKLAEQRPRVKGQFVRRVQTDLPPPETR